MQGGQKGKDVGEEETGRWRELKHPCNPKCGWFAKHLNYDQVTMICYNSHNFGDQAKVSFSATLTLNTYLTMVIKQELSGDLQFSISVPEWFILNMKKLKVLLE